MTTRTPRAMHHVKSLDKRQLAEILRKLSPTQVTLYQAVRSHILSDSVPPTLRELGASTGMSYNNAWNHLRRLERAGVLVLLPRQARGIRLVPVADAPKRVRATA